MNQTSARWLWALAPLVMVLVGPTAGCGSAKHIEKDVPKAFNNLRHVTMAYILANNDLGRPPKNREEITPYLKKLGDPNELLRSPNDGEDYVIYWGVDVRSLRPKGDDWPIWAYEKKGKDGKRWVLQERNIEELTEDQFRKATFAPGFKPPF